MTGTASGAWLLTTSWIEAGQATALVAARVLPIALLVPVFGGSRVPMPLRLAVGTALSAALVPAVVARSSGPAEASVFALLFARDLLVGFTLGFSASVVFHAAESAGALVDTARGATLARVVHPGGAAVSAPTGRFLGLFSVVLFFAIGGHQLLLAAIVDSFRLIPPTPPVTAALAAAPLRDTVIALTSVLFVLAVQVAAPAIVVALVVDFAVGVFGRMVLPANAFFLGLTLKGMMATAGVFLAMGIAATAIRGHFSEMLDAVGSVSRTVAGG